MSNINTNEPTIPLPNETKSFLYKWSSSPLPAWAFSTGLALSPMMRPAIPVAVGADTNNGGFLFKSKKPLSSYPTNIHVALFSAFVGLGGFMCYDNDVSDGSAVVGVWSLLYAMSNFKKSMWNLKLLPKGLTGLAFANATVYGGRWLGLY
ncbi:Aim19 protein [Martiniozyma asiatica (nom. inval.)]|nr:Aim19 protein [Martiniozyma asiatica]